MSKKKKGEKSGVFASVSIKLHGRGEWFQLPPHRPEFILKLQHDEKRQNDLSGP